MARSAEFVRHVLDLMAPLGAVRSRAMFGGHGIDLGGTTFAIAAAAQPNDVTDELFSRLKRHWSEGEIIEITALIAYFGFMNRYNDTMATPLEEEAIPVAEKHIAAHGWKLGKHGG